MDIGAHTQSLPYKPIQMVISLLYLLHKVQNIIPFERCVNLTKIQTEGVTKMKVGSQTTIHKAHNYTNSQRKHGRCSGYVVPVDVEIHR